MADAWLFSLCARAAALAFIARRGVFCLLISVWVGFLVQ